MRGASLQNDKPEPTGNVAQGQEEIQPGSSLLQSLDFVSCARLRTESWWFGADTRGNVSLFTVPRSLRFRGHESVPPRVWDRQGWRVTYLVWCWLI